LVVTSLQIVIPNGSAVIVISSGEKEMIEFD